MKKICVVIPMYNFPELTDKCIDLVRSNSGVPVDILVVDDCSDTHYQYHNNFLSGGYRPFINRLKKNSGYTNATNQGIIQCLDKGYDYVHLLNNDTEPEPDFIKILLETFDKDPSIGIACSARKERKGNNQHIENYPIDLLAGWQLVSQHDMPEDYYYAAWIPLCSALIKRETILYTGLLDKRMRNHCSDNDFCVRAGVLGYKTVLVPKSKVFHIHEVTTTSVGANAAVDQNVLMTKIRCDYMTHLLKQYPLTGDTKVMGKLEFSIEQKEGNNGSNQRAAVQTPSS